MHRLARIALWLLAGFLAFAPPGTLIFGGMLVLGWIGDPWLFAGVVAALALGGVVWWVRRHRMDKRPKSTEPT